MGTVVSLFPVVALAQAQAPTTTSLFSVLGVINNLLAYAIPILITAAVAYFIWGVIQYTLSTDEEAKKGARGKIINGLIGLFVIIAFWGIIKVFTNTFHITGTQLQPNEIPCIPNTAFGVTCPA